MDGSVTIGVGLDLASFTQSLASLESELSAVGPRIVSALTASLGGDGLVSVVAAAAAACVSAFVGAGWEGAGASAGASLASGISSSGAAVASAVSSLASQAAGAFSGGGWYGIGASMMQGVAAGVRAAGAEVTAAIRAVSAEAEAAVKSYYAIASPSRLMRDEVGIMISRGIAEGITDGAPYVREAMSGAWNVRGSMGSPVQDGNRSVTQNIYLRDTDASPYRTARRIRRESEAMFR
ncbi:MAG: hypothetical protein II889_07250 [Clostridia bacterium]|nr:hypothetical protein [Clostridia bacterium]